MMQVFPSFFVIASDGAAAMGADRQHMFAPGMAQYVWGGVFFIEHILFLFATVVCALVPDAPDWSLSPLSLFLNSLLARQGQGGAGQASLCEAARKQAAAKASDPDH
jgi:hypothetical protein